MITLLGVGHVFNLGPRIRQEIERRRPDLVCLELDEARLQALQADQVRAGAPSLYNLLAMFQRRIAAQYEADVGQEMLEAYNAARESGIPVALIDIDSMVTWRRLWSSIGPVELVKLLASAVASLFMGKERIERELTRYQEDLSGFLEAFGREYPAVKRVLVDERNEHMARRLRELHERFGNIVAVVGDGHVEGLKKLLEGEGVEVMRLWDLRSGQSDREVTVGPEG